MHFAGTAIYKSQITWISAQTFRQCLPMRLDQPLLDLFGISLSCTIWSCLWRSRPELMMVLEDKSRWLLVFPLLYEGVWSGLAKLGGNGS